MTTTTRNRNGQPIHVGDLVDVLSFGADGVEGGTVVRIRRVRGRLPGAPARPVATIRQASGREVVALVAHVVPR